MRLVLTHSDQHYAPKRHARYTPMPAAPPGVSFLCFERTRMVKTLRYAPARSLMYCVSAYPCFCLTPSLYLLRQSEPYCPRHRARTPHLTKQPTYVSINSCIKEHLSNESHKRTRSRRSPSSSITKFSLTYSLLSGRNSQQAGK